LKKLVLVLVVLACITGAAASAQEPESVPTSPPEIAGPGVAQWGEVTSLTWLITIGTPSYLYNWRTHALWFEGVVAVGAVYRGNLWPVGLSTFDTEVGTDYIKVEERSGEAARRGDREMLDVVFTTNTVGTTEMDIRTVVGGEYYQQDRWLCVSYCVGDLNGDHERRMWDAWKAYDSLGCTPFDPCWNACMDIDGDQVITETDAFYIASLAYKDCPPKPWVWLPVVAR